MAGNLAITADRFEQDVLQSDMPVLVDFWAEWCGPCKAIGPSIEQLASEYEGKAKVFKLDVDAHGEVASRYGVMSIPALLVFKGGKVVDQMVGAAPKAQIAALLDRSLKSAA
jgi:thioredoxin 1